MSSNFELTDKTQETLAAAIQLAKDYSNAHGTPLNYVIETASAHNTRKQSFPLTLRSFF